jgi:uncharacterized protein (TIGR02118 family)
VIVANSLIRRRDDIDLDTFRKHWLDPHGPLTAKLPRCLHYVQNHVLDAPGTNALARTLRIDGIPQLAFATPEHRVAAHGSAELAACDRDSEQFIGAVSRVITAVDDGAVFDATDGAIKQMLLFVAPRASSQPADQILRELHGVRRVVRHQILQQTHAPGSRVPNLDVAATGLVDLWLADSAAAEHNAARLDRDSGIASLVVKTYRFI